MSIITETRLSDSPYIEWIAQGYTAADGVAMRPAEYTSYLIFTRQDNIPRTLVVGALEAARPLVYTGGAESLWIRFRVGTFMPQIPASAILNGEIELPEGSGNNFWLKNAVWQVPNFENADTFVNRLAHEGLLVSDPLVKAALSDELPDTPDRTIRHRFQHSTGLRQNHIRQIERAERAAALLQGGISILDTVYELGYADQPHLTRSLKRFMGYTPREVLSPAAQPI